MENNHTQLNNNNEGTKQGGKMLQGKTKTVILISILIFALTAIILFIVVPFLKYSQATSLLSQKEYDKAKEIFTSLGNYRDSDDKVLEVDYQRGSDLLINEKFDEALQYFVALGDYKDSRIMVSEVVFQKAVDLLSNKKYDEAVNIFGFLGDYKNSKELKNESLFQKASDLISYKKYDEAITIFNTLGVYKNSIKLKNESIYQKAMGLLDSRDYNNAIIVLNLISPYKNSMELINEAYYQLSSESLSQENYEQAILFLGKIIDYRDSNTLLSKAKYLLGNQYFSKKDWTNAIKLFCEIGSTNYSDIPNKIAVGLINLLIDANFPIGKVVYYTADNDPNKLLGRPNKYLAKVSWVDERISNSNEPDIDTGGTIEIFKDTEGMLSRKDYIDTLTQSVSFIVQYTFGKGIILLRVSGVFTPTQAKQYESVLMNLP